MNGTETNDLGTILQKRRQECGLTVEDVANRTRIRRAYLQALEENRYNDLPGEAYIVGFLRNYATALGMKPSTVLEMYRGQVADGGGSEEVRNPVEPKISAPRRRKKSWGVLPWLSVALLVIGAIAVIGLKNFLSRPEPLPPREPVAVIDTNPPPPPAPVVEATPPTDASIPPDAAAKADGTADPALAAPAAPTVVPNSKEVKPGEQPATPGEPAAAGNELAGSVGESPLVFDFSGNGIVRLESFGANEVEFSGDNRAPQKYELTSSAVLSWKIRQNARISFADPSAVKLWVDQRPLNLAGRGEIFLQRKVEPGSGEENSPRPR